MLCRRGTGGGGACVALRVLQVLEIRDFAGQDVVEDFEVLGTLVIERLAVGRETVRSWNIAAARCGHERGIDDEFPRAGGLFGEAHAGLIEVEGRFSALDFQT